MSKLALFGGSPVRGENQPWPQWPISTEEDAQRIAAVTRTNRWSYDGPVEWEFAAAFTKYLGAKFGLCCANGTVAIQMALEALDIGAYDEVIVPGMTWQATSAACIDVNAIPILVDIEPDTWCIDIDKAEAAITRKTRAIIAVHLYGCMPDMTRLTNLCKRRRLFLIEDCAHQHGSFYKNKAAGSMGDIGCFSFQESKVLSSGEGGFNTCKTKAVFERLYSLRNCGRGYRGDFTHAIQSGNYRLTEWQAVMLQAGLQRLTEQVRLRDENAMYLNSLLGQIPGILPMRRRKEVARQSYFNFTFRLDVGVLKGVVNRQFIPALNAELRAPEAFEPPYDTLNNCQLYKPHTKRRYKLSPEYWKAINPKRFRLPVSTDATERTGVAVHHGILLGTKKDMDDVAQAVAKVVENIEKLRGWSPKGSLRKYRGLAK